MSPFGLFSSPNVEKLKTQNDVKGLIEALNYEKNAEVRQDAAEALGQIGDPRAVEPLIEALNNKNSGVRIAAATALGKIGDPRAIKPLGTAFDNASNAVMDFYHDRVIGVISDGYVPTPIRESLSVLLEECEHVQMAAAEALVNLGFPKSVDETMEWVKDKNLILGVAILVTRVEPLIRALKNGDAHAVQPLIQALKDKDKNVRREVAKELGEINTPVIAAFVEPLIEALKDRKEDVRYAAAVSLGEIRDTRAVEPLIASLNDEDRKVQLAAAKALKKLGHTGGSTMVHSPAAKRTENVLEERTCLALYLFNSNKISDEVSSSYGKYAEGELLKALSKTLKPDGRWTTPPSLVQVCRGDIFEQSVPGKTPTVRVFGDWLQDGTHGLDATNLDSNIVDQFKFGKNLGYVPYITGIGIFEKSHALRTHEELKVRGIVGYIGLVTLDRVPSVANIANELGLPLCFEIKGSKCSGKLLASDEAIGEAGLEQEDPGTIASLISALKNSIWNVREEAAEALGETGNAGAVEPLIVALRDNVWPVRQAAAKALGDIGDARAVEPLIEALKDVDERVRFIAAEALEKVGDARAVEPLILGLQDNDMRVREHAAQALGKIGDARAVEALTVALRDEDSNVREEAAKALAEISAPALKPPSAEPENEDNSVQKDAVASNIGNAQDIEPPIAEPKVEDSTAEPVRTDDADDIDSLIAMLKDRNEAVRTRAVAALGKIGDIRAVEPLIEALKDENSDIQIAATEALAKIGIPAVELLAKALKNRTVCVPEETTVPPEKIDSAAAPSPNKDDLPGTRIQRIWGKPRGRAVLMGGALVALIALGLFFTFRSGTLQSAQLRMQDTPTMMSTPAVAKPTSTLARQAPLVVDVVTLSPTVTSTPTTDVLPSATPAICAIQAVGLVAWWPGGGNANSMVRFHDGVLQNGATFASGIVGQAFRFDGANGYVRVRDDPIWDFASGSFTIDMWVNFNSVVSQFPHQQPLIGHTEGPGPTNKWIFWLEDGNLTFHINNPSASVFNPITYDWDPMTGNWYHVAVTREAHTWKLFIDGREVAATTNSRAIPDARVDLTIGKAEETWLDGLLDEVEIYNRALSAEEISAIFSTGNVGGCRTAMDVVIPGPKTTPTTEAAGPGTILFEEDFEDGLVQGLNYMVGSWEVLIDEAGNKVLEADNRYEPEALSFGLGSPEWSDYAVDYDLKLRNPAANLWLFVRNNNQGHYVQGLSVLYGGMSVFVTSEKNNWDLLKSRTYEFSRGVWYHMRLEVQGETIRVFINEKLEIETKDPQLHAGDVAFEVPGPARVQLDNLRVTILAPANQGQP